MFAQAPAPEDPYGFLRLMIPMSVVMVLFYIMMIRPQKRKEQELRDQVNAIKENDRVVTIGGIYSPARTSSEAISGLVRINNPSYKARRE